MRWTSKARFLFLAPAVVWVLAFTVFPLGYSLYIAFLKIDSKTEITRERVPMFNEEGEPGHARQRQAADEDHHPQEPGQHHDVPGPHQLPPHLQRPPGRDLGPDHHHVHPLDGEHRARARIPARGPLQPASRGARRDEGGHDPADLRDAARGGVPVLHHPLRGGRASRLPWLPVPVRPPTGRCSASSSSMSGSGRRSASSSSSPPSSRCRTSSTKRRWWTGPTDGRFFRRSCCRSSRTPSSSSCCSGSRRPSRSSTSPSRSPAAGPGSPPSRTRSFAFRTGIRFFDLGYASALCYGLLITVMIIIMLTFRRLRESYG